MEQKKGPAMERIASFMLFVILSSFYLAGRAVDLLDN